MMDSIDRQVTEKFAAFEQAQDPTPIYEALDLIEASERDLPAADPAVRRQAISRRFHFFAALDRVIDPRWNPDDVPVRGVAPPPSAQGMVYSSGEVDPATIADPAERAEYERALKASKDYERFYGIQLQLRRIDERAMQFAARFLAERYTNSDTDRQEFDQLLAASPMSAERQQRVRSLLPSTQQQ